METVIDSCGQYMRLKDIVIEKLLFIFRQESFPRLGQMIVDYDPPIKKLSEEFIPHSKVSIEFLNLVLVLSRK